MTVDRNGDQLLVFSSIDMDNVPRVGEEILESGILYNVDRVVYDLELNKPQVHIELKKAD